MTAAAAPPPPTTIAQLIAQIDAKNAPQPATGASLVEVKTADLLTQPLQRGMEGEPVRRMQEGLARFVPVQATGVFDEQTENAVKAFQKANHIKEDGQMGNYTFAELWTRSFWEKGVELSLNGSNFTASFPKHTMLRADLKAQRVSLINTDNGQVVKTYPISSGSEEFPTPQGHFKITQVREKPSWYPPHSKWAANAKITPPGPNNPLGPAAMRVGWQPILFHGVPRAEWGPLGHSTAASHGCMRMYPQDAWELHKVISVGTAVEVQ